MRGVVEMKVLLRAAEFIGLFVLIASVLVALYLAAIRVIKNWEDEQ